MVIAVGVAHVANRFMMSMCTVIHISVPVLAPNRYRGGDKRLCVLLGQMRSLCARSRPNTTKKRDETVRALTQDVRARATESRR